MRNVLKKLNYLLTRKNKIQIVFILFLTLGGAIAELLGVAVMLPVINLAMDTNYTENVWCKLVMDMTGFTEKDDILLVMVGATIVIYIGKSMYLAWMNNVLYKFSAKIKSEMAEKLMTAYLRQPYKFFLQKNSSELIRAVNQDTGQIYEIVLNCLLVFSNGLTACALIITLLVTNVVMTIVIALLLSITAGVIFFVIQKKTRYYGRRNQKITSSLIKYLQQTFEGIKEIKIIGNEYFFINRYIATYRDHAETGRKYNLTNLLPKYLIETVCIVGIMSFLGYNIIFVPTYMEIIPQLAVFVAAAIKLLPSVNALYSYANTIIYHKAAIDVIYEDVKEANELNSGELVPEENSQKMNFSRKIELQNLSFQYDTAGKIILDHVNLEVSKGKSVALIGPSGGGKTTTADIILGLLTPTEGKVLVDGIDIQTNLSGWRRQIGYIPQNIYLMDDSIKNNIALGVPEKEISEEQVWKALEAAQLSDFVKGLEQGIETQIGERGARISGGQRQRIGIARAMYHDPDILVFDEATSALDTKTEEEVMKAIDGLHGSKTMIMIAHRLSTIENCDIIYRIENGQVKKER
ncbi:MAG: ABC transporter ATP-binding protein [Lachnospiraceae bacterium]|nr:ABC transporter ATP-binding protein [Lachnospiraceae bacterium]